MGENRVNEHAKERDIMSAVGRWIITFGKVFPLMRYKSVRMLICVMAAHLVDAFCLTVRAVNILFLDVLLFTLYILIYRAF
jgi:hypothetical protein